MPFIATRSRTCQINMKKSLYINKIFRNKEYFSEIKILTPVKWLGKELSISVHFQCKGLLHTTGRTQGQLTTPPCGHTHMFVKFWDQKNKPHDKRWRFRFQKGK